MLDRAWSCGYALLSNLFETNWGLCKCNKRPDGLTQSIAFVCGYASAQPKTAPDRTQTWSTGTLGNAK